MTGSLRTFIAVKTEPQPELIQLIKHLKKIFEKEKRDFKPHLTVERFLKAYFPFPLKLTIKV